MRLARHRRSAIAIRRARAAALALAVLAAPGCAIDELDATGKQCTDGCPGDLVCVEGVCREGPFDAGPSDAGTADASDGGSDAGPAPDAAMDADLPDPGPCPGFDRQPVSTIAAGSGYTCAIESGALFCWGLADRLGIPGRAEDARTPVLVDDARTWRYVTAAHDFACALDDGGGLSCWGANGHGQLGNGTFDDAAEPTPVPVPDDGSLGWTGVDCEGSHCCGIDEGKRLWCWGWNATGQLLSGALSSDRADPQLVGEGWIDVDVGDLHTCGIREDGRLACGGCASRGATGQPVQMDAITSPQDLPGDQCWRSVAAGQHGTCAIGEDERMWCFGANGQGQNGLGFQDSPVGEGSDGCVNCDSCTGCTDEPLPIEVRDGSEVARRWRTMDRDWFFVIAVRLDGTLWGWGRAEEHAWGVDGVRIPTATPVVVEEDGEAVEDDWVEVTAGHFHGCARHSDGSIFCSGCNEFGETGTDTACPPEATRQECRLSEFRRVRFP